MSQTLSGLKRAPRLAYDGAVGTVRSAIGGDNRARALTGGALAVVLLLATAVVLAVTRSGGDAALGATRGSTATALPALIVFRHTARDPSYGRVAVLESGQPDTARSMTPASCERVVATPKGALCLTAKRGTGTTYAAALLDPNWAPRQSFPLDAPSVGAALSDDATIAAVSVAVAARGTESKPTIRTTVLRTDGSTTTKLEEFALALDGTAIATQRDIWGVAFVDNDVFYATVAVDNQTWLVLGRLSTGTLTSVRGQAESLSLSPDHKRLIIRKHTNTADVGRLAVYDLESGGEVVVPETRSVDGQVVWLDDKRVIYALARTTDGVPSSDVWVANADGSGEPQVLITDAWSPSVVH